MFYTFPLLSLQCVSSHIGSGRSYSQSSGTLLVSDCGFSRVSDFNGDGGVIYADLTCSLVVSLSFFLSCGCQGNGGAIYTNCADVTISKVCGGSCRSSDQGIFGYFQQSGTIQMEYLSVTKGTSGYRTIYLRYGSQTFHRTNISHNSVNEISGLITSNPTYFSSQYCTIANNQVSDSKCLYLCSGQSGRSISGMNIIGNNSPGFGVVTCDFSGSYSMTGCIFNDNSNTLLCATAGSSLTVSQSSIAHTSTKKSGSVTTSSITLQTRTPIPYTYFESLGCQAQFPLYPPRTPTMYIPSKHHRAPFQPLLLVFIFH